MLLIELQPAFQKKIVVIADEWVVLPVYNPFINPELEAFASIVTVISH